MNTVYYKTSVLSKRYIMKPVFNTTGIQYNRLFVYQFDIEDAWCRTGMLLDNCVLSPYNIEPVCGRNPVYYSTGKLWNPYENKRIYHRIIIAL